MKILVFYKIHTFDEIDEAHYFDYRKVIVNLPENLIQSEFKDFIIKNYYDKIHQIEIECVGSLLLLELTIISCEYISELYI